MDASYRPYASRTCPGACIETPMDRVLSQARFAAALATAAASSDSCCSDGEGGCWDCVPPLLSALSEGRQTWSSTYILHTKINFRRKNYLQISFLLGHKKKHDIYMKIRMYRSSVYLNAACTSTP